MNKVCWSRYDHMKDTFCCWFNDGVKITVDVTVFRDGLHGKSLDWLEDLGISVEGTV